MAAEMGKPIGEGAGEVNKCADHLDYYAANAERMAQSESTEVPGVTVTYRPLGVIFAIMPWNFPLWQVFRQAGTAMSGGNTVLLKHAPNVRTLTREERPNPNATERQHAPATGRALTTRAPCAASHHRGDPSTKKRLKERRRARLCPPPLRCDCRSLAVPRRSSRSSTTRASRKASSPTCPSTPCRRDPAPARPAPAPSPSPAHACRPGPRARRRSAAPHVSTRSRRVVS
eukprot:4134189-Prymnesium_polylepis.1